MTFPSQAPAAEQPTRAESEHSGADDSHKSKLGAPGDEEVLERVGSLEDAASVSSDLPQGRTLGLISACGATFNRIVGTGVFATTSTLFAQSGSVGMVLIYYVIGALIAGAGFAVYAEFACALPKNGGELNYLQHAYRRPKHLVLALYASQALLLGQAAGNAGVAGRYFWRAGGNAPSQWSSRAIGVAVIVSAVLLHGTSIKWGVRFQNAIGAFKIAIMLVIVFAGFAALGGHTRVPVVPSNFDNAFAGSRSDIYGIASCIYNALWSYVGFSNTLYAAGELKNPTRTIRRMGPIVIGGVAVLYVLIQVAYFAAVPREQILASTQIIAAEFFANVFGERSARALSVFVALSATANVYAVIFAQGRVNQALGRDGLVPFSKVLASNRPFNAPLAGLAWHAVVTLVILLAPPAGDAYNFVLNLSSYPLNVINTAVGFALVLAYLPLSLRPAWAREWTSPFRATLPVAVFFTLVSAFLVVVPWLPPVRADESVYDTLWYALAPAVSIGIFALGAVYWLVWYHVLPRLGGYTLVPVDTRLSDNTRVTVYEKRKTE